VHFRRGQRGFKCGEWSSCSFTQSYVFGPDALVIKICLISGANDGLPEDIGIGGWHGRVLVEIEEEFVDLKKLALVLKDYTILFQP